MSTIESTKRGNGSFEHDGKDRESIFRRIGNTVLRHPAVSLGITVALTAGVAAGIIGDQIYRQSERQALAQQETGMLKALGADGFSGIFVTKMGGDFVAQSVDPSLAPCITLKVINPNSTAKAGTTGAMFLEAVPYEHLTLTNTYTHAQLEQKTGVAPTDIYTESELEAYIEADLSQPGNSCEAAIKAQNSTPTTVSK